MMRAVELVMHEYYLAVCNPTPKPVGRLSNWGEYIVELKKRSDADVLRVIAMIQQIKDHDRNLIMHPDLILSADEAFTLFEIGQSVIMAMAPRLLTVTPVK